LDELVDWNGGMLDSYGICGKPETPQATPRRLRSRPMESEHPVMEINITLLLLRKFDNYLKSCFSTMRKEELLS